MKKIFKRLIDLLDFRFYVGILLIWFFVLLIPGFAPDVFNLKTLIAQKDLIGLLLTIITSLFGILIAIILLSFGIFREKFGRVALTFLIKEKNFGFLINLLLSVTLFLLIAYIIIYGKKDISDFSITIAYISIYLVVFSLFLIFPISVNILSSPDSLTYVEKIISSITKNKIDNLIYNKSLNDLERFENIDKNPISIVRKFGVSLLKYDDKLGFSLLLIKLNDKILGLIDENPEREHIGNIYSIYSEILQAFTNELILQNDEETLKKIWLVISSNHKHFSDKNIQLLFLEELDFFTQNFIDSILNAQLDNVTKFGLYYIKLILEYHYNNSMPEQSKISSLMYIFEKKRIEHNTDIAIQWENISSDIPYYFTTILEKSIELKNKNVLNSALNELGSLAYWIINNNSIGEYQKAFILKDLLYNFFHYQIEAFKNNIFEQSREIKFPSTNICNLAIERDAVYKKSLLSITANFYIELFRINKLDFSQMFSNYLAAIGRNCANKYHINQSYKESLMYILKVFIFLKKEFEKELNKNSENYLILKSVIESFIEFHKRSVDLSKNEKKEEDLIDNQLLKELTKVLGNFKKINISDSELEQNIIKW